MNRSIVSGILIAALVLGFASPTEANSLPTNGELVGALVGVVAVITVVTVVVIHQVRKKRTITGCVNSETSGMTLTDDKDKRTYVLSGNSAGITTGDRVKLRGKKTRGPASSLVWQTKKVVQDFGACHP
jgi:hypothetical protein